MADGSTSPRDDYNPEDDSRRNSDTGGESTTATLTSGGSGSRRSSYAAIKFSSFVKKVRMGKRITNAFTRDKGQPSAGSQEQEDDPNKPPEPYICTGHFQTDFTELCKRANMEVVPQVIPRPQRPPSPTPVHIEETKAKPAKGGDKKKQAEAPPPDPEPEPELDENGEPPEPPPKTYTTKDKFEYFKPGVQVEMDNPDKQDTVTEIYIKGWRVDTTMMEIFKECWTKMDRLHTLSLWYTGLTDDSIIILSQLLPECPNLRNLILDNNPVKGENYYLLLKEESPVQNLSLRYNAITDKGAEFLGKMLGTTTQQNSKLLSLNLNGNRITDQGVEHLAKGLRMNRNLLSLGLANNQIGDKGAQRLGEVLSRFILSHDEIIERRKLLSEKGHPDRKSVSSSTKSTKKEKRRPREDHSVEEETAETPPPGSRRADSRDRPGSVRSTHGTKGGKSAKNKKTETKGKEDEKAKTKGKDDKAAKKGGPSTTSGRNSGASVVNDTKGGGKKGQTKGKGKGSSMQEIESASPTGTNEASESSELANPLLDTVEHTNDGGLMLVGNRTLLSLNLSSNLICDDGMKALLLAVGYQSTLAQFSGNKPGSMGLMRLCVNRNKVGRDNESLHKLNTLMMTKDPFYKPPTSPDAESQASKS